MRSVWVTVEPCGCATIAETGEQVTFCRDHLSLLTPPTMVELPSEVPPASAMNDTPPRS